MDMPSFQLPSQQNTDLKSFEVGGDVRLLNNLKVGQEIDQLKNLQIKNNLQGELSDLNIDYQSKQ